MVVNRSVNDDTREKDETSIVVDPLSKQLPEGETRKLDTSNPNDAWTRSAPVPKGFYTLRLNPLAKDAAKQNWADAKDHSKGFSYSANLEFTVVSDNPDINGSTVYGNCSTQVYRGKPLSTMAAIIIKLGYSPFAKGNTTQEVSDRDLLVKLAKIAAQSPLLKDVFINWKIQYQDTNSKRWVSPMKDMDDFPDDGEGGKLYEVKVIRQDTRTSEVMYATNYIQWDVVNTGEKAPAATKTKAPEPEPELVSAPKSQGTVKKTPPAPVVDDVDDELQRL